MKSRPPQGEFDAYATGYEAELNRGLSLTGEGREFYARGRVRWTARCLDRRQARIEAVLDFGCGTGDTLPLLREYLRPRRLAGIDVSARSLELAQRKFSAPDCRFVTPDEMEAAAESFNLVYTNGVFHHIPPTERPAVLDRLHRWLRPGGWLAFWENNAWHPGTRWIMSRVAFDRDARPFGAARARRLLRNAGFEIVETDFLFVFPRALGWLRPAESLLCRLPLGGQYQVLARRPV
ncbi:MAG: methyltransferase domain-containing protein [Verrucomicrobiales bacterium]|nr:methyltransferase domain-containing protein [Verrucomicrobiales bacterium]